jgi:hypothetical protein
MKGKYTVINKSPGYGQMGNNHHSVIASYLGGKHAFHKICTTHKITQPDFGIVATTVGKLQ